MTRFLRDVSLLGIGFIGFAMLPSFLIYHGVWTRDRISRDTPLAEAKFAAIEHGDFDVVVLGSSRVYRHVNPRVVAEQLPSGWQVFNSGLPGFWPPRETKFVERILNGHGCPDVLVVELNAPEGNFDNLISAPVKRASSPISTWRAMTDAIGSGARLPKRVRLVAYSVAAALHKYTGFGIRRTVFEAESANIVRRDQQEFRDTQSGFLSLEDALEQRRRHDLDTADLEKRRELLRAEEVRALRELHLRKYDLMKDLPSLPSIHELTRTIAIGAQRGCRVIYMLSPRVTANDLALVYPNFRELPEDHRLDLSNPSQYPLFYEYLYSYDNTHLNGAGAELFSVALGQALSEKLGQVAIGQSESDSLPTDSVD